MKRLAFYLLLLLAIGGGLVWALMRDPGYVLLTYDHFRYESTLWVFVGLIVGLWLVIFLVRRSLDLLLFSSTFVNPWSERFQSRRLLRASRHGQRELAEGQWDRALTHLRVAAGYDRHPLNYYLGAARAATELQQYDQSEKLLDLALKQEPDAILAVGLARAGLQLEREDWAAAHKTLEDLHLQFPRQPQVLRLLLQLNLQLQDWTALCQLLPELRRQKALPAARLDRLERQVWVAALEYLGHEPAVQDPQEASRLLQQRWKEMPSSLHQDALLVEAYARSLWALGATERALEALQAAISRHYPPVLVELFGRIPGNDPAKQLAVAEDWLKTHPGDPALLLTLGRLYARTGQPDRARSCLEESLPLEHGAEARLELACLLARQGDAGRSSQLFLECLQPVGTLPAPASLAK